MEEDRPRYSVVDSSHNNKPEVVVDSMVEPVRPAGGYLVNSSSNNNLSKRPARDYSEGRAQPPEGRGSLGKHSLSSSKQVVVGGGVYLVVELAQLLEGEGYLEASSSNHNSKLGPDYSVSATLPPRPNSSSSSSSSRKVGVSLASLNSSLSSSLSNNRSLVVGG